MNSTRRIIFYAKMGICYLTKRIVNANDYGEEYDDISRTYQLWTQKMGKHTKKILRLHYLGDSARELRILDLACGSGYITSALLEKLGEGKKVQITAVDISRKMIELCRNHMNDQRASFIHADAFDFLRNAREKYDAIFCGWALCYLNHRRLLRLMRQALRKDGIAGIIVNIQGTLQGIEDIFLDIMEKHMDEVQKIMDIRFNLPQGVSELRLWFSRHGFAQLESGEGEELAYFDAPGELYGWLRDTGAGAGFGKISRDREGMERMIIEKIGERKLIEGKYVINHKFAYGIFRKKGD